MLTQILEVMRECIGGWAFRIDPRLTSLGAVASGACPGSVNSVTVPGAVMQETEPWNSEAVPVAPLPAFRDSVLEVHSCSCKLGVGS